jgi:fermentation-respiration switch protein FrsA (DUF1100 family)
MKKALRYGLVSVVALYVSVCGYLYFQQTRFVFTPRAEVKATPEQYGCVFEEVSIPPNSLNAYWLPSGGTKTVVLHHGNEGNIGDYAERACALRKMGLSVLLFDYRGYGKSKGEFPSESRVYEDAEAAWDYLKQYKHILASDIVLYGHSLGAAVAIEMATRHPDAAAVIAESGFTSVYDMGILDPKFKLFPVSLILNQRMDSISKVANLKVPLLIIHGTDDKAVPASMSEALFAAAAERKKLLLVANAEHDNVATVGGDDYRLAVTEFVN